MTMKPGNEVDQSAIGRRDFVKSAGAAGAGILLVTPEIAFGSRANSTLQLGTQ